MDLLKHSSSYCRFIYMKTSFYLGSCFETIWGVLLIFNPHQPYDAHKKKCFKDIYFTFQNRVVPKIQIHWVATIELLRFVLKIYFALADKPYFMMYVKSVHYLHLFRNWIFNWYHVLFAQYPTFTVLHYIHFSFGFF